MTDVPRPPRAHEQATQPPSAPTSPAAPGEQVSVQHPQPSNVQRGVDTSSLAPPADVGGPDRTTWKLPRPDDGIGLTFIDANKSGILGDNVRRSLSERREVSDEANPTDTEHALGTLAGRYAETLRRVNEYGAAGREAAEAQLGPDAPEAAIAAAADDHAIAAAGRAALSSPEIVEMVSISPEEQLENLRSMAESGEGGKTPPVVDETGNTPEGTPAPQADPEQSFPWGSTITIPPMDLTGPWETEHYPSENITGVEPAKMQWGPEAADAAARSVKGLDPETSAFATATSTILEGLSDEVAGLVKRYIDAGREAVKHATGAEALSPADALAIMEHTISTHEDPAQGDIDLYTRAKALEIIVAARERLAVPQGEQPADEQPAPTETPAAAERQDPDNDKQNRG